MLRKTIKFPKNFLWGAATASYQIEGAFNTDGRGESIWDRFSKTPGKTFNGDTGDVACDHYHRFEEDISIMAELGLKAYRFSIAWPRVIPQGTGKVNQKGLDFYDRLTDKLLKKKILPFATLYHWDLPQAMEDKGGWRSKETSYAFAEYTRAVVERLSDRVTNWMTLNEPPCSAVCGYSYGTHAPGAKETNAVTRKVLHHLLLAHGLGVQTLRAHARKKPSVGLAHCYEPFIPLRETPADIKAQKAAFTHFDADNLWGNRIWLDAVYLGKYPDGMWAGKGEVAPPENDLKAISSPTDFLGVNIYYAHRASSSEGKKYPGFRRPDYPENYPKNTFGWPMTPECIYYTLKNLKEVYKVNKFYITENGTCLEDVISSDGKIHDYGRVSYLREHIAMAHRAIQEGIGLKGYFTWSLLDNFEWNMGYSKRLGLVYVDFKNAQKRILKDSAHWYKEVTRNNGFEVPQY